MKPSNSILKLIHTNKVPKLFNELELTFLQILPSTVLLYILDSRVYHEQCYIINLST